MLYNENPAIFFVLMECSVSIRHIFTYWLSKYKEVLYIINNHLLPNYNHSFKCALLPSDISL